MRSFRSKRHSQLVQEKTCLAYLMQDFSLEQKMSSCWSSSDFLVKIVDLLQGPAAQSVKALLHPTVSLVDACSCVLHAFCWC